MKRILCVGQAPPKADPEMPFGRTKLYRWFEEIGLSNFQISNKRAIWDAWYEASFEKPRTSKNLIINASTQSVLLGFTAIYNKFPGSNKQGHFAPTHSQISGNRDNLKQTIEDFKPDLVIPIGKLSIEYCIYGYDQNKLRKINMNEYIGKEFELDPYELTNTKIKIIPLPHPSGASTWFYIEGNKELLEKALMLIKNTL